MRVVKHEIYSNTVEFFFEDGVTISFVGGRPPSNNRLAFLDHVTVARQNVRYGEYDPQPFKNPDLLLKAAVCDKGKFCLYWSAARDYFQSHFTQMERSNKMSRADLRLLHGACRDMYDNLQDGRLTKIGTL